MESSSQHLDSSISAVTLQKHVFAGPAEVEIKGSDQKSSFKLCKSTKNDLSPE